MKLLPFDRVLTSFHKNKSSVFKLSSYVTTTNISLTRKLELIQRFYPAAKISSTTYRALLTDTQLMSSTISQLVFLNSKKLSRFISTTVSNSTTQIDLTPPLYPSTMIAPTRFGDSLFPEDSAQLKYYFCFKFINESFLLLKNFVKGHIKTQIKPSISLLQGY